MYSIQYVYPSAQFSMTFVFSTKAAFQCIELQSTTPLASKQIPNALSMQFLCLTILLDLK